MYTFVASEETSGNLLLNLTYKKSSYQINIWNKMQFLSVKTVPAGILEAI